MNYELEIGREGLREEKEKEGGNKGFLWKQRSQE
jgi:hypothetical protein